MSPEIYMTDLHYIPLSSIERDTEIVRLCLRKYGRQLQKEGEIPPEVSEAEINEEMEKHVPRIVAIVYRSPSSRT